MICPIDKDTEGNLSGAKCETVYCTTRYDFSWWEELVKKNLQCRVRIMNSSKRQLLNKQGQTAEPQKSWAAATPSNTLASSTTYTEYWTETMHWKCFFCREITTLHCSLAICLAICPIDKDTCRDYEGYMKATSVPLNVKCHCTTRCRYDFSWWEELVKKMYSAGYI